MNGNGKVSQKQELAIAKLLAHGSIRKASAAADISDKTLRQWLKDPGFQAAYAAARRQLLTHAVGRLQAATGKAVSALVRRLRSARDGDVIRAATVILDKAVSGGELLDVLGRIEALEAAARRHEQLGN